MFDTCIAAVLSKVCCCIVGVVMGLAWTSLGGNALYIEAAVVEKGEGKGGLRTTGQLF
jgi:ATP-dependent Lon protease